MGVRSAAKTKPARRGPGRLVGRETMGDQTVRCICGRAPVVHTGGSQNGKSPPWRAVCGLCVPVASLADVRPTPPWGLVGFRCLLGLATFCQHGNHAQDEERKDGADDGCGFFTQSCAHADGGGKP